MSGSATDAAAIRAGGTHGSTTVAAAIRTDTQSRAGRLK
jgi:hypothetical protein